MDTVPPARFGTSARSPARFTARPEGPAPKAIESTTFNGSLPLPNATKEIRSDETTLLGSLGSSFVAAVTKAYFLSGNIAMEAGGPTREVGITKSK